MSAEIFAVKIDVMKIDKARLFIGKNGAKYLDAVMLPTARSSYGDSHMIVQGVSKEERLKGIKGPIIGNAKIIGGGASRPAPQKADTTTTIMKSEPGASRVFGRMGRSANVAPAMRQPVRDFPG